MKKMMLTVIVLVIVTGYSLGYSPGSGYTSGYTSGYSWAGDLDDGIAIDAGFSSTNDDLKLQKNYSFTRMKIRSKIERAKVDDSIMIVDDCQGAGNVTVVGNQYVREVINVSDNRGAVSTCNK